MRDESSGALFCVDCRSSRSTSEYCGRPMLSITVLGRKRLDVKGVSSGSHYRQCTAALANAMDGLADS